MFRTYHPNLLVPKFDYDDIPNLDDFVLLTNDIYGTITDLEYLPNHDIVFYRIKIFKSNKILKNVQSKHIKMYFTKQHYNQYVFSLCFQYNCASLPIRYMLYN